MAFELRLDSSTLPAQCRDYLRTSSSADLAPVEVPRLHSVVRVVYFSWVVSVFVGLLISFSPGVGAFINLYSGRGGFPGHW